MLGISIRELATTLLQCLQHLEYDVHCLPHAQPYRPRCTLRPFEEARRMPRYTIQV